MQPYGRVFNFSAGPSTLPVPVLEQARDELLNFRGTGMSVMEMSHRSKPFEQIIGEAEADLKTLVGIPDGYKILFLQGGASLQFSMVAMAFLRGGQPGDYVVTGAWGQKAVEAGRLEGHVNVVWDGKEENYRDFPDADSLTLNPDAAFLHVTSNETIQGVELSADWAKGISGVPVICDMSSDILSRPFDVADYGLIYAGAQKNMGPAGATLVIVREDLLAKTPEKMHPMLDYRLQAKNNSLYNTPPCWSIYVCGLVYKHLLATGGLEGVQARNEEKAQAIYGAIDGSNGFYRGHAALRARSRMNVTFTLPNDDLSKAFLKEAAAQGLDGLAGHRSVGGVRASIYNAFPLEGAQALAQFMADFAGRNG